MFSLFFSEKTRMDAYCKERLLGKGGFGEVWKAKNVHKNIDVAIKEVQINEQTKIFIEREKELMEKCDHRNIITFFDAIASGSIMNFILEYCCHGDLDSFFKGQEHRVSFEQCLRYMENIASGVEHLHDCKICHRDLKPCNILVQSASDGVTPTCLKVADLGLGRSLTASSSPAPMTANIGTPGWQAPEIPKCTSSSSKRYSLPVDIFSLGLLFLAMLRHLTGKHLLPLQGMLKLLCSFVTIVNIKQDFFICISIYICRIPICIWIIVRNACCNFTLMTCIH